MSILRVILLLFRALFRDRSQLALENLALRQQLAILRHQAPRPRLRRVDRAFWVNPGADLGRLALGSHPGQAGDHPPLASPGIPLLLLSSSG